MATEGQGSARIVLVRRTREGRRRAGAPPVSGGSQSRPSERAQAGGWTVRRLVNGASLGGIGTVAGGLVFQRSFHLFGDSNSQLLAMGFGLFVIGMVVFTLCLIGLSAAAVRALVAGGGWGAAALAALAPAIPLFALWAVGAVSYAFPALFVIIVAGGFALALKR